VRGAEINRDRDLRLHYLAGWGINSRMQDTIYRQVLTYRDLSITRSLPSAHQCNRCGRPSRRLPARSR
jgi:hypothetical protein